VKRLPRHVSIALLTSLVLVVGVGVGGWYLARPPENEGRLINRVRTIDRNYVEVELYHPKGFPVRNAAMFLRIGEELSFFGGYYRGDTRFVTFRWAPEQFERIQPGDPVLFYYQGDTVGTTFGPIDKGRLDKGPILPLTRL
jgi:hypothetical protein